MTATTTPVAVDLLTPAYCAQRVAYLLDLAEQVAEREPPGDLGSIQVRDNSSTDTLLAIAEHWESLGVAMSRNMAMVPRPKEDDT